MAAGQIYDHGFGGAGKTPIGGVFNTDQFPDKLADITSGSETPVRGSSRVRRALAAIGIGAATHAEAPAVANTHAEQPTAAMNGSEMPHDTMQMPGAHTEIPGGVQDAPPDLNNPQRTDRV